MGTSWDSHWLVRMAWAPPVIHIDWTEWHGHLLGFPLTCHNGMGTSCDSHWLVRMVWAPPWGDSHWVVHNTRVSRWGVHHKRQINELLVNVLSLTNGRGTSSLVDILWQIISKFLSVVFKIARQWDMEKKLVLKLISLAYSCTLLWGIYGKDMMGLMWGIMSESSDTQVGWWWVAYIYGRTGDLCGGNEVRVLTNF